MLQIAARLNAVSLYVSHLPVRIYNKYTMVARDFLVWKAHSFRVVFDNRSLDLITILILIEHDENLHVDNKI